MAIRIVDQLMQGIGELRYQPTGKRVRALVGDRPVVDTTQAVLVWEPRRVVPYYAVPVVDVLASLVPTPAGAGAPEEAFTDSRLPFVDHGSFRLHTCPGDEYDLRVARSAGDTATGTGGGTATGAGGGAATGAATGAGGAADSGDVTLRAAAFRPRDPDLAGHAVLDFDAFDGWLEEDEPIVGHPRDPFHRVDARSSSRHVQVMLGDRKLAESARPVLVFETHLPVRFYLPGEDVDVRLLRPSRRRTVCAYKGVATYRSVQLSGYLAEDIVWSYERPLAEMSALAGLFCFFDERVDVIVDGRLRDRPLTHWS